jgi:hypothetical protein
MSYLICASRARSAAILTLRRWDVMTASLDAWFAPRPGIDITMTTQEAAAVAAIFADELDRGWIPRPADIEDALGALRESADWSGPFQGD